MKFTERLMDYGLTLDEDVIICDRRVVDQAADLIDELEQALREARVYVPEHHGPVVHKIESVLKKLERLA